MFQIFGEKELKTNHLWSLFLLLIVNILMFAGKIICLIPGSARGLAASPAWRIVLAQDYLSKTKGQVQIWIHKYFWPQEYWVVDCKPSA